MRLSLRFELDAGFVQAKGEALLDLTFSAQQGQAVVEVRNLTINSSSSVFDVGSRLLSRPLRQVLAQELSEAINTAIYDLPRQEPRIKKIEIVNIQD